MPETLRNNAKRRCVCVCALSVCRSEERMKATCWLVASSVSSFADVRREVVILAWVHAAGNVKNRKKKAFTGLGTFGPHGLYINHGYSCVHAYVTLLLEQRLS